MIRFYLLFNSFAILSQIKPQIALKINTLESLKEADTYDYI